MSRAFCACLLPVSLALPAVPGAADPRCPEAACCEDKARRLPGEEDGLGFGPGYSSLLLASFF